MDHPSGKHIIIDCITLVMLWVVPTWMNAQESPSVRILFDDLHGQSIGNADWVIEKAYSDFAETLRESLGAAVHSTKDCSGANTLTEDLLHVTDVLIIPEPNIRFTGAEIQCIRSFVMAGGGLFLIADHGGSDRNFDGWDSALIFNELVEGWGICFSGDTWSETPVKGPIQSRHPVMDGIQRLGAWAATSIILEEGPGDFEPLIRSLARQAAYCVAGRVGSGRVIAIGDSSPFDDGTGDMEKSRHSAYVSWLYDHPRFAAQAVGWLTDRKITPIPENPLPYPTADRIDYRRWRSQDSFNIIIDAAHGNNTADVTDRFADDIITKTKARIFINRNPITSVKGWDLFILSNPSEPLAESEMDILHRWVRKKGGALILTTNNARNPLSGIPVINALLQRLNSTIRVNADEILDEAHNTGRPWSMIVSDFNQQPQFKDVERAVFWGTASLIDQNDSILQQGQTVTILAQTAPTARSQVLPIFQVPGGKPIPMKSIIPVAAIEKTGKGRIVVLGADTLTNFQYPTEEEKRSMPDVKWDHHTDLFNLRLVNLLKE